VLIRPVYYCNSSIYFCELNFSGETAFKHMSYNFGWACYPMIHRLKDIASFIPMTVICGARSSVDSSICQQIQELRRESYVDTHVRFEILFVIMRSLNNVIVSCLFVHSRTCN